MQYQDSSLAPADYIISRRISKETMDSFGVTFGYKSINLPVYDKNGNRLFFKHRHFEGKMKYTYDAGASAALYGVHLIDPNGHMIVITEGETQVLTLHSDGIMAVSSTGGAGTWKEDWCSYIPLEMQIFIVYDNDDPGRVGAQKVANSLLQTGHKHVAIRALPDGIKDIGELYQQGESLDVYSLTPIEIELPKILQKPLTQTSMTDKCEEIKKELLAMKIKKGAPIPNEAKALLEELSTLTRRISRASLVRKGRISDEDVEYAKQVPIETLYDRRLSKGPVYSSGTCPFHKDDTPSFVIYHEDNRFKCYGCNEWGDAITFMMKYHNLGFIDAVKRLT